MKENIVMQSEHICVVDDGLVPNLDPPIGTEHCDWLYGIFGHETSCTRYWTCWNGTATEQLCIGGLLYNENAHSCDWPENVDGCQKHPLCNEDPNGNVPLGKSCNRYWQCQGGYPRLQRCPAMLVFDRRSLRCVVPPTDECEIPTTTLSPQEEEENSRPGQQNKRPDYPDGQPGRQRARN
ncbi:Chondroitin proteoglycan-2 [Papilio machaon]|uniref:Chondroitin proteoglycan-2 n=1 Tax=Papilio machaon TaxID=76193 RepID=A0A194RF31_PAPMA|nr:Chondroitin proteoglycan-2 [Papilio machaon]